MGFGADQTQRFTPWILGGMVTLSLGGVLAALATTWMGEHMLLGVVSAVLAFVMIGMGVSACGTTLLVLLSKGVGDHQRATSATLVWTMMIFGFALTSIVSGKFLDPFSFDRLLLVSVLVSVITVVLSALALWGLERRMLAHVLKAPPAPRADDALPTTPRQTPSAPGQFASTPSAPTQSFKEALRVLWSDSQARLFTFFVFTSMLAYSAQDLILEPFAALIYHYTPGQTTQLSGLLHAAVLMGMLLLALIGSDWVKGRWGRVSTWMVLGCLLSSLGMLGLCAAGVLAGGAALVPLQPVLWVLGLGNGLFSIAAISTMMRLATQPSQSFSSKDAHTPSVRPGLRMGLWGGAQAVAFGLGGLLGSGASDLARHWMGNPSMAYASVFALEATLFLCSATIAWQVKNLNRSLGDSQSVDSSHQTHSGPRSVRVGMPANFSARSNQNFKVI
jgi:BCD family chlorophyll transporter-like MFS transporter